MLIITCGQLCRDVRAVMERYKVKTHIDLARRTNKSKGAHEWTGLSHELQADMEAWLMSPEGADVLQQILSWDFPPDPAVSRACKMVADLPNLHVWGAVVQPGMCYNQQ